MITKKITFESINHYNKKTMRTYLRGFGLENFRVFKDFTMFDFAPITILTGPNSSGKSSLNRALLFLKDNSNKKNLPPYYKNNGNKSFIAQKMQFSTELHGLVNGDSIKNIDSKSNIISFISYFRHPDLLEYHRFEIKNKELIPINRLEIRTKSNHLMLKISLNEIYFDPQLYNKYIKGETIKINEDCSKKLTSKLALTLDDWFIHNNESKEESRILSELVLDGLHLFYEPTTQDISYSFYFTQDKFRGKLDASFKIRGNRSDFKSINNIDLLEVTKTSYSRFYDENSSSPFKTLLEKISNADTAFKEQFFGFINKWTNQYGIGGMFDVGFDPERKLYFPNIDGRSLTEYGFGYSQIGTILFKLISCKINSIERDSDGRESMILDDTLLILEEPESNLHPNYQSLLADVIVDAAETFGIQFIIETHSEYLIRRLQFLTLKSKVKPEDTVIYYFKDPNNTTDEPLVKKINIQKDGRLTGTFGKGFFDETGRLMASLLTGEYLN